MILDPKIIKALEALAENGTACIDGDDRELFRTTARAARVLSEPMPDRVFDKLSRDLGLTSVPKGAAFTVTTEGGVTHYLREYPRYVGGAFPFQAEGWDAEANHRPTTILLYREEANTVRPLPNPSEVIPYA